MEIQAHGLKVTVLKLGRKSSYLGGRRLRVFFFFGFGIKEANDLNTSDNCSSVYHYPGHTLNTSARNNFEAKALISHPLPIPTLQHAT